MVAGSADAPDAMGLRSPRQGNLIGVRGATRFLAKMT